MRVPRPSRGSARIVPPCADGKPQTRALARLARLAAREGFEELLLAALRQARPVVVHGDLHEAPLGNALDGEVGAHRSMARDVADEAREHPPGEHRIDGDRG